MTGARIVNYGIMHWPQGDYQPSIILVHPDNAAAVAQYVEPWAVAGLASGSNLPQRDDETAYYAVDLDNIADDTGIPFCLNCVLNMAENMTADDAPLAFNMEEYVSYNEDWHDDEDGVDCVGCGMTIGFIEK